MKASAININDASFTKDPYAIYRHLRREQPVRLIKGPLTGDGLLVTRYEDVEWLLRDTGLFASNPASVGKNLGWLEAWWTPKMLKALVTGITFSDDPDHSRLRGLVHQAFTPRRVREIQTHIETLCHDLLDKGTQQDSFDLITGYALPLPSIIIAEMMGVALEKQGDFQRWSSDFLAANSASPLSMMRQAWNGMAMYRFFKQLIQSRRDTPQDDLTTALVQARYEGDTLSEEELIAMLFALLLAGHETTTQLIGSGVFGLLTHPQQWEILKNDPDQIPAAIEELMRWASPVQWPSPRFNLEDVELSGIPIPTGSRLYPGLASANHDERYFDDPATLDVTRKFDHKQLGFGLGAHYCIGAPLGRLEGSIALRVLMERCPNLQLAIDPDHVRWSGASSIRGLKELPVRCG